jgi:hypothetical protein
VCLGYSQDRVVLYVLQIDTIWCQNCVLEYLQDRVVLYVLQIDTTGFQNSVLE